MKRCTACKLRLSPSEFGRNRYAKDGLHYYCKVCAALKRKSWYEANTEKAKAATMNWKRATAATHGR
jgi:hypothetical protein